MGEWQWVTLGDVLEIEHGFAFKGQYFDSAGSHVLLTPKNFKPGGGLDVSIGRRKYYRGPIEERFILKPEDIVIAMTDLKQDAPILGSAGVVPGEGAFLHNQRIGKVHVTKPEQIDPSFVPWILNSPEVRGKVRATATGATVRHTAPSRICAIRVRLPSLTIQKRMTAVLAAFEQLVENSERRINLLEDLSRSLYREWFVHFRFPGHKRVRFIESAQGPIPSGWKVCRIEDVAPGLCRGISPKYAENGDWTVVNQRCIRNQRLKTTLARRHQGMVPEAKQLREGDVVINSTGVGTLGRVAIMLDEVDQVTVDSHVTIARAASAELNPWFGLHMLNREALFETMGVGSTGQTELGRKMIGDLEIVVPSKGVLQAFGHIVEPLLMSIPNLLHHQGVLQATRDLLFPRLIAGELGISSLDLRGLSPEK